MQLLRSRPTEKMIGSNSLKTLVSQFIHLDIADFEVKVSTHIQEKENLVQNLQKCSEAKDIKIEELNKKLEEEKIYFQAMILDSTKKDEVIRALEVKVRETTLKNSKNEKKIESLVQMIREEKAKVKFLDKRKTQETWDIAEIRSILGDSITSEIQEKINKSSSNIKSISKDIAKYGNEDILTEKIDLNEFLEMERFQGEKDVQDEYIPIQNQYMDSDLIKNEEVSVDIAHTDTLSDMINNYDYKDHITLTESSDDKFEKEKPSEGTGSVETIISNGELYPDNSKLTNKLFELTDFSRYIAERRKLPNNSQKEYQDRKLFQIIQTSNKISCNDCKLMYNTTAGFVLHRKSIHEGIKYKCDKCNYEGTQKGNLKTHRKVKHGQI